MGASGCYIAGHSLLLIHVEVTLWLLQTKMRRVNKIPARWHYVPTIATASPIDSAPSQAVLHLSATIYYKGLPPSRTGSSFYSLLPISLCFTLASFKFTNMTIWDVAFKLNDTYCAEWKCKGLFQWSRRGHFGELTTCEKLYFHRKGHEAQIIKASAMKTTRRLTT